MEILINATNGRQDKNDVVLQSLTHAKSWKQALAHCEKRLKKGEKNDKLLLNKAMILYNQPDGTRAKQGLSEIYSLVERKPPITNSDILLQIDAFTQRSTEFAQDPRLVAVWERAIGERPSDEQLVEIWFRTKFLAQDYKAAQKAAMVYAKNFPQKRRPFFWAVLSSHLAASDNKLPEREQQLFEIMAFRLLSKAAADVPTHDANSKINDLILEDANSKPKGPLDSSRALQDCSELRLLVFVYRSQQKYKEALIVLDDLRTGLRSPLGSGSWDLVIERIELLALCGLWEDVWHYCHGIILEALEMVSGYGHTTKVSGFGLEPWSVLSLSSLLHHRWDTNSARIATKTKSLIDLYHSGAQVSRNARLALIAFHSQDSCIEGDDGNALLMACLEYWFHYCAKPSCFKDLGKVHVLRPAAQEEFLATIWGFAETQKVSDETAGTWMIVEINALKQDYYLVISRDDNFDNATLLNAFVSTCLRLYRLALKIGADLPISDRRPGDDAAILAAMGCIHLYQRGERRALLRCVLILETLLLHSRHHYEALAMIVRVYIYLGAAKKAMEHYSKLDIKHLQFLTETWILFTRISTIHPHSSDTGPAGINHKTVLSPHNFLKRALDWTARNDRANDRLILQYLEHDSFPNLLSHLILMDRTTHAMVRYFMMMESCRIIRFGLAPVEDEPKHPKLAVDFNLMGDTRRFDTFPNYESIHGPRCEGYIRSGPLPGVSWIKSQFQILHLISLLRGDPDYFKIDADWHKEFSTADGLTEEELATSGWVKAMLIIASVMATEKIDEIRKPSLIKTLPSLLSLLETNVVPYITEIVQGLRKDVTELAFTFGGGSVLVVPDWHFLHILFNMLDEIRITLGFLLFIATRNIVIDVFPDQKSLDERVVQFMKLAKETHDTIHATARKLRNMLATTSTILELTSVTLGMKTNEEDPIGAEMRNLVDAIGIDEFVERQGFDLAESWRDSLEGITKIKLN